MLRKLEPEIVRTCLNQAKFWRIIRYATASEYYCNRNTGCP